MNMFLKTGNLVLWIFTPTGVLLVNNYRPYWKNSKRLRRKNFSLQSKYRQRKETVNGNENKEHTGSIFLPSRRRTLYFNWL